MGEQSEEKLCANCVHWAAHPVMSKWGLCDNPKSSRYTAKGGAYQHPTNRFDGCAEFEPQADLPETANK